MVKKGDRVHAGIGTRGGAGITGTVTKVEKDFVTLRGDVARSSFGSGDPYKPLYRASIGRVTKL